MQRTRRDAEFMVGNTRTTTSDWSADGSSACCFGFEFTGKPPALLFGKLRCILPKVSAHPFDGAFQIGKEQTPESEACDE
jgi:hypothetical protein